MYVDLRSISTSLRHVLLQIDAFSQMTSSTSTYRAAAVQMTSGEDKEKNLADATRLVEQAAAAGATLIALPELFKLLWGTTVVAEQAEPIPGPTSRAMSALAARLQITLGRGEHLRARPKDHDKPFNTSVVFGPGRP